MQVTTIPTVSSRRNAAVGPEASCVAVFRTTDQTLAERISESLRLLQAHVPMTRRIVHAGDSLFTAGQPFVQLYIVNTGCFKGLSLCADGREQVTGLQFRGDWLGFDGISNGRYTSSAVAMDTGEVWAVRYDALLRACTTNEALMAQLHAAMSSQIGRDRDALVSMGTLPADARVANFLRHWAEALEQRGLRTDQITLRMTRAEIGNHLGMTLETVSRALGRLSRAGLIGFAGTGRREIAIPSVEQLAEFITQAVEPQPRVLQ
jgi:CRP/FNR family transcriptional regulator